MAGGDSSVWLAGGAEGTAEILSVSKTDPAELSFKFVHQDGFVEEKPVEGVRLSEINDWPGRFDPQVGDRFRVKSVIRWKGKRSAGPAHAWHDHVDERTITYLGRREKQILSASEYEVDPIYWTTNSCFFDRKNPLA